MHETCLLDAPPERVGQLRHPIWHLNDADYNERIRKSLCYCQIEAEDILQSGRRIRWFHFLLAPLFIFCKTYFYHAGFRDGILGLISSVHAAGGKFRTCALAWDCQNHRPRAALEDQVRSIWSGSSHARPATP